MLMEIDPLPMRGSLVMTMVMISPSRREVSPVEQLCRSPRLVPPCGGRVSSRELAYDFFLGRKTSYSRRWASEGHQGAHEAGGAPPTLVARVWPPFGTSCAQYFLYILKMTSVKFQDFWSCAEQSLIFAPFLAQNPSCWHSPSSCKPCKIRENRHKYCDIMCNNSP